MTYDHDVMYYDNHKNTTTLNKNTAPTATTTFGSIQTANNID